MKGLLNKNCCETITSNCCDENSRSMDCCNPESPKEENDKKEFSIKIDGKVAVVKPEDKNIVDVADRAKIGIPAPCYRDNHQKGCCKGCVVEVDGKKEYACSLKPKEGMEVVVNRPVLISLRKERLKEYAQNIKNGTPCECTGGSSCC